MSYPSTGPGLDSGAPTYGTAATAPQAPPANGLAIAGLVLAFLAAPIGLVLSIMAMVKRRRAGASIGVPLTGVIVSTLLLVIGIIAIVSGAAMLSQLAGTCSELGPGVWEVDGVTYTCG